MPAEELLRYKKYEDEVEQAAEEACRRMKARGIPVTANAPVKRLYSWKKLVAAAIVSISIGAGIYYFNFHSKKTSTTAETPSRNSRYKDDVTPGSYKAKLTLADGNNIVLDSTVNGELGRQGTTAILKNDGQLVYNTDTAPGKEILYNTLTTGKGETFSVVLTDGSRVWLNAGSSIAYPAKFTGNERTVTVTGEAYFEVQKDATMPFVVKIASRNETEKVEVLGTRFNINAYDDEKSITTTLVEGRIRMQKNGDTLILKPGEQSVLAGDKWEVNDNVNKDKIIAWKSETFYFSGDDIKSIMRQLERWYNIEVKYEGIIPAETFSGRISRKRNLSEVLRILETDDVHFSIDGKKLTVLFGKNKLNN